jgi:hypothetical protein
MTLVRARWRALLLAVLVTAGNLGLPVTDALLDHGLGATHAPARPHYETSGGCHDRAEHCMLGRLLGELRLQSPVQAATRFFDALALAGVAPHQADHAVGRTARLPRSRAPPPLIA